MRRNYSRYVIIGGGPVGSSVAYHLARQGVKDITVLERDACYKTSSAMFSAGGIRQQFSVPENVNMTIYGAEFIKNPSQLEVDGETPDFQFHENGYLFLAGSAKGKEILLQNHQTQRECGATWMKVLEPHLLKTTFPWLSTENIQIGSYGTQNEGYFDPWMFVSALKKKSMALGVRYIEGTVLNGKSELYNSASTSEYRLKSIQYQKCQSSAVESIEGETFVNAAGAWSGRLVQKFASNFRKPSQIKALPVVPRARSIFAFHAQIVKEALLH